MKHYKESLLAVLNKLAATSKNKPEADRLITEARRLRYKIFLEEVIKSEAEADSQLSYSLVTNDMLYLHDNHGTWTEIEL